jgi:SNF2 family DNA or RNA helicase
MAVKGTIERHGGKWFVEAEPHIMIRLKRIFPRVKANRAGALVVQATPEVSRDLEWILSRWPMEMHNGDKEILLAESKENKDLEKNAEEILGGGALKRKLKWEVDRARQYQLIAADLALATGALLVTDDIGLGKTLSGLLVLRDEGLLPALIVCQTHLTQQWLDELNEFMPWLTGHIARKGTPYKLANYHDGKRPDVLIMNYAKLAGWAPALRNKIKSVIYDEIQELRRSESQKYTAAGTVADPALCVVGTTATPVYNYGDEVFNIMDIVKPGALGERDEFVREWGAAYGSHIGVRDPGALASYLKGQNLMIQRTRKEVGRELPDTIKVHHSIESDDEKFNELMEGQEHSAELLVSREASREELFQLSGDFEWQLRRATGIAKAPFVAEFAKNLIDSGEKIVLFGWHHSVYDLWRDALADFAPAFYTGKESPAQKLLAKQMFIDPDSDCRVFIMSLRAGAGLDGLQTASNICIFGELDWSPTMHEQCIGRLARDGMEEPVVAYFMVSDHGSDPFIADTLQIKRGQSEPFMDPHSKLLSAAGEEAGGRAQRMAEKFLHRS